MPVHAAARRPHSRAAYHSTATPAIHSGSSNSILQLQRTVGNQAVLRMLSKSHIKSAPPTIQREFMTVEGFVASAGAAKEDIKVPGVGFTLKKQSQKFKRIIDELEGYHKALEFAFTNDMQLNINGLNEANVFLNDLFSRIGQYKDAHKSAENPDDSRNAALLELRSQVWVHKLIWLGIGKLIEGKDKSNRLAAFLTTGNGSGVKTIKELFDKAPQTDDPAAVKAFFGIP